ncbi:anti-sigma factor [Streptomyces sp. NPDC032198]|uniref:anti-sigma factor n=1 Tax=Streptomyces sp. NPDC032198 TaxID=3155127 RepID=UPI0033C792F9
MSRDRGHGGRRTPAVGRPRPLRRVHSLAAPYALDALEPLAGAAAVPPPPGLRERVLTAVRTTEQDPAPRAPVTRSAPPRSHALLPVGRIGRVGPFGRVAIAGLTALALAVTVILAVQLVRSDGRLGRERAEAREIAHVLAAPDARVGGTEDAWGRGINVVASESRRRAVVTVTGSGAPLKGRAHQLWLRRPGSAPRSLGVLDGETPVIATILSASATSLAVTTEPDGGSEEPTSAPLVQLALESVGFGE